MGSTKSSSPTLPNSRGTHACPPPKLKKSLTPSCLHLPASKNGDNSSKPFMLRLPCAAKFPCGVLSLPLLVSILLHSILFPAEEGRARKRKVNTLPEVLLVAPRSLSGDSPHLGLDGFALPQKDHEYSWAWVSCWISSWQQTVASSAFYQR